MTRWRRPSASRPTYAGTEPHNVLVSLTENESIDWSFGLGVAHYVP
ncbi:hypothetical protein ABZW11_44510 [Nonomuraea sp. NPDC004580]